MCTININALEMVRQVFWQANYLHSSEINLINKNNNCHNQRLLQSKQSSKPMEVSLRKVRCQKKDNNMNS